MIKFNVVSEDVIQVYGNGVNGFITLTRSEFYPKVKWYEYQLTFLTGRKQVKVQSHTKTLHTLQEAKARVRLIAKKEGVLL